MQEKSGACKNPLFLRFINGESTVSDVIYSVSKSPDTLTSETAKKASENPPDISEFKKEITDAVRDLVKKGMGEEFSAFVNHYMEPSIIEDVSSEDTPHGENKSRVARIKDADSTWIQGIICYNLCLYIKSFGLDELKECRVCGKLFGHKGKYAVYCSDSCKSSGKNKQQGKARETEGTVPSL